MHNISATWTLLASSDRLRRSSQILSAIGSQIIIFGGELVARQPIDNKIDCIELAGSLDSSSNAETYSALAAAPSPRVGSAAASSYGSIYLFSGRGGVAMAPIEEHGALWQCKFGQEASNPKWTLINPTDDTAPFPVARSYHAMASDGEDALYIHAGCPESGRLSDLWSFHISSGVWKELSSALDPPRGGTSIAFTEGKLYRMNGFDGVAEQGGSVDVYDPTQNSWSSCTYQADGIHGPEPRSVGTLLALKIQDRSSLITVFGEGKPSDMGHAGAGNMFSDCWVFDIERQFWSKIEVQGTLPAPRGWFAADVTKNGAGKDIAIIHGGLAEDNSRLGDVWQLEFR